MVSVMNSGAPTEDIKTFIDKFYHWSDTETENEPWINAFTSDAYVQIGPQKAKGTEEIRKLRSWIWDVLAESKHNVQKVLITKETSSPEGMMTGDAKFLTKDKATFNATWAGHVELKKDGDEWKFSSYRVWSQNE